MIQKGDYKVFLHSPLHHTQNTPSRKRQSSLVFVNVLYFCSVLMPHVDNSSLNYFFLGISSNLFNLVYL